MIDIPIEERYNKNRRMFHSGWFVAAGTLISVGSAAYGAYSSSQNAKKAAGATRKAGKKLSKEIDKIAVPQWNLARDIKEAGQVTDYNIAELEQIFPGAKTSREIAGQTAIAYQKGEIPKDVRDSIMRSVAELGGAGFNPATAGVTGGFQAAQGLLGRQLGLQSVQLSQMGNQISQSWQSIAGSFIESPLQVGQARLGYEKAAAEIQLAKTQAKYGAAVNTIGANLAADQALSSGIASTGQALGSGISSYGAAMGAARAAGTGSTAMTDQGFYKDQVGAANQYNVAPSQLSYQKGSGGFMGIGGKQGGYYYNPGGQYGRADIPRNIVFGS
jgi:hypothetical protein